MTSYRDVCIISKDGRSVEMHFPAFCNQSLLFSVLTSSQSVSLTWRSWKNPQSQSLLDRNGPGSNLHKAIIQNEQPEHNQETRPEKGWYGLSQLCCCKPYGIQHPFQFISLRKIHGNHDGLCLLLRLTSGGFCACII